MNRVESQFMSHVAGLRGLAIVMVVLFHLNGQEWAQGYLGVDVFLVITGYLLVRGGMRREQAWGWRDALAYLGRRVQRIIPPMAIIIVLTVGAGIFLLQSSDEWLVSSVGWSACLARANMYLTKLMANYFAPDAAFNPLLHLWYLSIMLQVYLGAALVTPLLQRVKRAWSIGALGVVGCASFAWWLYESEAYYDTLPRVWEILAGGVVCLLPELRRPWATAGAAVGLGCVALSGLGAIPACVPAVVAGAVLCLRYMPGSHLGLLLSNRPLLWLGKVSFSLYVVHMPVIVYWRMWLFGEVGMWDEALMLAAVALLGAGYYRCVEKRRPAWWLVALVWLGALSASYAGRKTHGFRSWVAETPPVPVAEYHDFREWTAGAPSAKAEPLLIPYRECLCGRVGFDSPLIRLGSDAREPDFVMIGDSHASHLCAGMNEAALREGFSGVFLSTIVLPFKGWSVDHKDGSYSFDPQKEEALLRWLAAHPGLKTVLIAQRWIHRWNTQKTTREKYTNDLRLFINELRALGKRVVIMAPTPEYGSRFSREDKYGKTAKLRGIQREASTISLTLTAQQYVQSNEPALSILRELQAEGLCTLVEPLRALAPGEVFSSMEGGVLQMADDNHLSARGSIRLAERLAAQLREALSEPQAAATPAAGAH